MAATGYTPIQLYYSTTASQIPLAANLANGELAINITDGKIYYKNNSGVVTLFGSTGDVSTISFGTTGLTPSTATGGAITVAGTLVTANGGTGLNSFTSGDLMYYSSGTSMTKLGIGTNGQILTSTGTAPQWSTLSGVAVTTFSAGTTGLTPSSATSGAITLAGTLVVSNGGTGLTSLTAGYIPFGAGTSAFGNSANLFWDNTNTRLGIGTASPSYAVDITTSATSAYLSTTNGTVQAVYGTSNGASAGLLGTFTNHPQVFWTNNAERMRITAAGDVGIGTSSPSNLLHVSQASSDFQIRVTGTSAGNAGSLRAYNDGGQATGFGTTGSTNSGYGANLGFMGTITNIPQIFLTNNTERMRITSAGSVGIGITTPTAMLHTAGSSSVAAFETPNIIEVSTVTATAATGTINYDITTQSVLYYTSNASGNFTINFRGSSGTSLNTIMATGDTFTVTFLNTNGSTAYYNSAVQIDGSSVTPKWQGGTAPSSGNASSIDAYTYAITKTGSAAFTVLASQTRFA